MDQEKRVLLAFALSFALLLAWRFLFMKQMPPPARTTQPAPAATAPGPPQPEAEARTRVQLPIVKSSEAQEIVIEGGDLYRLTFDTRGAVVRSWILKKYRDEKENPLDVVNAAACEQLGFPMSVNLGDAELARKLNSVFYVAAPAAKSFRAPGSIEFAYSDGKIQARKKFLFGSNYEVRAEVSVFDGLHYLPVEVAWPGGFGDHSLPPKERDTLVRAVYATADGLTTVPQGKVKEDRLIPGPFVFAGLEDRYFVDVFLPGASDEGFRIGRRAWTPPDWKGKEEDKPRPLVAMLGSPLSKPLAFRLFVGPKDLDVLRAVNPPLDRLVDFGWFSFVAKPLFLALRYIHAHWVHNYGWAIMILTVIINLALFPLKLKSIRSAQEMQRVAPLVKSIQERYKSYKFNDPRKQRMQQEIMKVYQEHGINPLGGCLPMVLQIPFLYAFYSVLSQSIELRHAVWILWVRDLSSPDRLYILPTIMIVTTYLLQQMTPMATGDPAQQRMMKIMPLLFGFMFFNFASGLVLYWLTGNVVSIAQQMFINRKLSPAPDTIPAVRQRSRAEE